MILESLPESTREKSVFRPTYELHRLVFVVVSGRAEDGLSYLPGGQANDRRPACEHRPYLWGVAARPSEECFLT